MSEHPILSRINAYAARHKIKPETVVRKATGDPRGLRRLKSKLEGIEVMETWLDANEVTDGTKHCASCPNVQPSGQKSAEGAV